jgi:hypothetical protein
MRWHVSAAVVVCALVAATSGCVVAPPPEPEWVPGYWTTGAVGWVWMEGYWVDRGWRYQRHGWDHDHWRDHGTWRDRDGWRDHDRWQGGGPDRHRPAPPAQGRPGKLRPGG